MTMGSPKRSWARGAASMPSSSRRSRGSTDLIIGVCSSRSATRRRRRRKASTIGNESRPWRPASQPGVSGIPGPVQRHSPRTNHPSATVSWMPSLDLDKYRKYLSDAEPAAKRRVRALWRIAEEFVDVAWGKGSASRGATPSPNHETAKEDFSAQPREHSFPKRPEEIRTLPSLRKLLMALVAARFSADHRR
jgi:hypothetical protein